MSVVKTCNQCSEEVENLYSVLEIKHGQSHIIGLCQKCVNKRGLIKSWK